MINIEDRSTITELFSFVHPRYKDKKQRLYFSNTSETMIEWLSFDHVFLYQRISVEQQPDDIKQSRT